MQISPAIARRVRDAFVQPVENDFEKEIHRLWMATTPTEPRDLGAIKLQIMHWINTSAVWRGKRLLSIEKLLELHGKAAEAATHCHKRRHSPFSITTEIRLLIRSFGLAA